MACGAQRRIQSRLLRPYAIVLAPDPVSDLFQKAGVSFTLSTSEDVFASGLQARKAFQDGDFDYGGEVAGKLRLLVTEFGSNRPLLLDLMAEIGISPLITLGGPPIEPPPGEPRPGEKILLSQQLQLGAIGIRVPSGEFVMLNKTQLIRGQAEQTGSSHEDWSLDPALEAILRAPIYIGGLHGAFAELRITTETVLHVADRFLTEFRSRPKTSGKDA